MKNKNSARKHTPSSHAYYTHVDMIKGHRNGLPSERSKIEQVIFETRIFIGVISLLLLLLLLLLLMMMMVMMMMVVVTTTTMIMTMMMMMTAIIIIMYIYYALIDTLGAHMTHINLKTIFYTRAEHSPADAIYIKC